MGNAHDGTCCDFCGEPKATPVPPDNTNTPRYLPGSKGSHVLNEHLRLYFVASKLLQCSVEDSLRLLSLAAAEGGGGGKGSIAEACGPCNKIISKALQLHEQIGALQGRIAQLGKDLKGRISQNQSSPVWSNQLRELLLKDPTVKMEADPDDFISDREDFHFEDGPEDDSGDIGDADDPSDPLEETETYTASSDDIYHCKLCNSIYKTLKGIKRHAQAHKESNLLGNPYECHLCRHPNLSEAKLRRHVSSAHGAKKGDFVFDGCGDDVDPEGNLKPAPAEKTASKFSCDRCQSMFASIAGLKRHRRMHKASDQLGNLYDCPHCRHPTVSERNLRLHIATVHRSPPHKNSNEEVSPDPEGVEREEQNMPETDPDLEGDILEEREDSDSDSDYDPGLRSSKKASPTKDGPSTFPCHLCESVFSSGGRLKKHLRMHKERDPAHQEPSGENPLEEVDKATAPKERKFSCPDCKSAYTTLTGINKHRRLHMESFLLGNLHDCKICGYPNTTELRLHRHMRAVHSVPNRKKPVELSGQLPVPLKAESDSGDPDDNMGDRPRRTKAAINGKSAIYEEGPSDDEESDTDKNEEDWTPQQESEEDDPDATLKKKSKRPSQRKEGLPHHCDQCNVGYASARGYERHREEHLASAALGHKFDCHCGFPASSEKRLRYHKRQSHIEGPVSSKQHLKAHVSKPHGTRVVKRGRKEVRNALNQNRAAKRVRRRPLPLNPRQNRTCPLCQKVFGDATLMKYHLRLHEEYDKTRDPTTGLYHCPHCKFVCPSRQGLIAHKAARHHDTDVNPDLQGFLCTQCGKSFYSNPALKRHVKNIHENTYHHTCEVCGKGFDHKQTFLYHKMTHEEVRTRSFICDLCGASYSHKHSLTNHMKKYHSSMTNEAKAIVNDTRRFPNVKEYRCKHCQAVFPYKYLLASHLPVAHAEVYRFSCDQCDKKYTNASGLRLHKEIFHSDGRLAMTCPYCGKGFPHKHYATTHYRYCQGKRDMEEGKDGTNSAEPIQNLS